MHENGKVVHGGNIECMHTVQMLYPAPESTTPTTQCWAAFLWWPRPGALHGRFYALKF